MEKAYLFINTVIGQEQAVRVKIAKIKGVTKVELVYGVYDMVVTVEHEDKDGLRDIVTNEVRRVDDVRSTLTMIVTS